MSEFFARLMVTCRKLKLLAGEKERKNEKERERESEKNLPTSTCVCAHINKPY